MAKKTKTKAKFKWSLKNPKVQYALAFAAGIVAVFAVSFFALSYSSLAIFNPPPYNASFGASFFWYNVLTEAYTTVIPAATYGLLFWLFGFVMRSQGVNVARNAALIKASALVAALFLLMVVVIGAVSNAVIQAFAYYAVTILNGATLLLIGLFYDVGWWLVHRKTAK